MPPMTGYSFGDVVLVPFPFTDQSATKRRPAVTISGERYNSERPDLIIIAVTSQGQPAGSLGDVPVKEWKAAGLLKPSVVKPVITTIEQPLVIRRLGRLEEVDRAALRRTIATILG